MRGDARITGGYTRVTGGGIMAALRNNGDSVTIAENASSIQTKHNLVVAFIFDLTYKVSVEI